MRLTKFETEIKIGSEAKHAVATVCRLRVRPAPSYVNRNVLRTRLVMDLRTASSICINISAGSDTRTSLHHDIGDFPAQSISPFFLLFFLQTVDEKMINMSLPSIV